MLCSENNNQKDGKKYVRPEGRIPRVFGTGVLECTCCSHLLLLIRIRTADPWDRAASGVQVIGKGGAGAIK